MSVGYCFCCEQPLERDKFFWMTHPTGAFTNAINRIRLCELCYLSMWDFVQFRRKSVKEAMARPPDGAKALYNILPPPEAGMVWWHRPAYWHLAGETFDWSCPFCHVKYETRESYGDPKLRCPCGALFHYEDRFGTWMAKQMTEQWAAGRKETWG